MSRETCQTGLGRPRGARDAACYNLNLGREDLPNSVGALFFFFSGRRADARAMPRYFFILVYPDPEMIGDPHEVIAPSDEAAIGAARKVIDELLAECGPEDPNPTIVVKNEAGEVIYRFPSN